MIDIHIHILPGLDDGPPDMEEAITMARNAVDGGIKEVVATPHVIPGLYHNNKGIVLEAVQHFQQRLEHYGIPLQVHPGMEYMIDPGLPQLLRDGEALTLGDNGKYLLVEFPAVEVPVFTEHTLFEIALQGVIPVIAHPERNGELLRNPNKLLPFLERGALCQGTAGSLTGLFGRQVQHLAWRYLRKGCYSFVGSDAHGSSGSRPPGLDEFCARADEYGDGVGQTLTTTNPARLLQGKIPLSLPEMDKQVPEKSKGLLGKLWQTFSRK